MNPVILKLANEFVEESPNIVPKQISDDDYFYPKLEGDGKYSPVLKAWSQIQGDKIRETIVEGLRLYDLKLPSLLAGSKTGSNYIDERHTDADGIYQGTSATWFKRDEVEVWPYSSLRYTIALRRVIGKETDDHKIARLLAKYSKDKILLNFDHGQLLIETTIKIEPSTIIDLIDSVTPPGWLWLYRNEHLNITDYHGNINLALIFGKDYKSLVKMAQEAQYYLTETDFKRRRNPDEELSKLEQAYQLTGGEFERKQLEIARRRRGLPMYQHDCDGCIFLGNYEIISSNWNHYYDLYVCHSRSDYGNESLIARFGSEGPDYASSPAYIIAEWVYDFYSPAHPELVEAWHRAKRANLLEFPESRGENLRICGYCWGVIRPESGRPHCSAELQVRLGLIRGRENHPEWTPADRDQAARRLLRESHPTIPTCYCGHLANLHNGPQGRCTGTGAMLDPEYNIPAEEQCLCEEFIDEDTL